MAAVMMTLGAVAAAEAGPITFDFTGVVDSVSAGLAGSFASGDLLSGSYTFESTTAPRAGSDSHGAVYDAVTDVSFALGSYSAATAGLAPNGEIQVDNDPLVAGFFDRYALVTRVTDGLTGPPVSGQPLIAFGFRLDDTTNTAFADALTLPTALSLSDFTSSAFFVFFGTELVSGTLTSISKPAGIPEPATLGLTALGLAVVARRRFRRALVR
jgi:hypothetical protein